MEGQRFGKLVAIRRIGTRHKNALWLFRCDCGKEAEVTKANVAYPSSSTRSCGCVKSKGSRTTHGMSKGRFYHKWTGIQTRCNNPKESAYRFYGGRGIKCLWQTFGEFFEDMHPSYIEHVSLHGVDGTTLERVDVESHYCKQNCKWATWEEQRKNRTNSRPVTFRGRTQFVYEWAKEMGLPKGVIWGRLHNGWTVEETLTTPKLFNRSRHTRSGNAV